MEMESIAVPAILPITTTVMGNEKAWAYQEVHMQSLGSKGFCRYQRIIVNRDGRLAEFMQNMGPVKNFKGVRPINIPSLWEHTVDELMDLAQQLRNETAIDLKDWLERDTLKLA